MRLFIINLTFLLLILQSLLYSGDAQLQYPDVRRDETVIDDYHGTKIADPYQWLEILDSEETQIFIETQTNLTADYLENLPIRQELHDKLTELVNYPKYSAPIVKGGRYFDFYNSGLQNHDVFRVYEDLDSEDRILVDTNDLSDDGSIAMGFAKAVSPDGKLFVYTLTQGGTDWVIAHFVNVTSGIELEDKLEFILWPDFTWMPDGLGLFYSRYPLDPEGIPSLENPQIYYHAIGTPQSEDRFITDHSENPDWFLFAEVSSDGNYLLVKPQPNFQANAIQMAILDGSVVVSELKEIFSADLGVRFIYVTNNANKFIFLSDYEAPNFRLIQTEVDLSSDNVRTNIEVLVQEHENKILKWVSAFDGNKLILCYFEDVKHKLEVRDMQTGSLLQEILLDIGIISDYSISKDNSEFFFKFENLVTPGKIFRCSSTSPSEIQCTVHREISLGPDTDLNNFLTEQVFYPSKDGTLIPMFIAHKKDFTYDGNSPALLYGYGGFNVDVLPTFSAFNLAFMDHFDGVYASANIRGGAEYGEKWHQAGMLLNKQNVFDDFQAAAEYLITRNYTSPKILTIQGASNGGLLVGTCVNQRPDLFGVALSDIGLHDMLRYQNFTVAYLWCSEYGCSDNKTHFDNLVSYSPLHNIKTSESGIEYPSILVSTADKDDRVVPSHSYKYLAELQHTVGRNQKNPILLRVEKNAGHNGDAKPTIKQIADYVDAFSFIDDHLHRVNQNSNAAAKHGLGLINVILAIIVAICWAHFNL